MFKKKHPWEGNNDSIFYALIIVGIILGIFVGFILDSEEETETKTITKTDTKIVEKEVEVFRDVSKPIHHITADSAIIVGGAGNNIEWEGEKLTEVDVDFNWKADVENDIGSVILEYDGKLNPEANVDLEGKIRIEFTTFEEIESYMKGGIVEGISLYGETGHDHDYLPEAKAFLAAWGRGTIFLDGYPVFENLEAHISLTEGIRREDGTVRTEDNTTFRQKLIGEKGFIDPEDREIQLFLRSRKEAINNFPEFSTWVTILIEEFNVEESSKKELLEGK